MAEKPILGLRAGEEVSPVHQKIDRNQLLTDPSIEFRDIPIDSIYGLLIETLGVELPLDMIAEMSFDSRGFNWVQLYHPNALSAIFIGGNPTPEGVDQAQGIIEVASFIPQDQTRIHAAELIIGGTLDDSASKRRAISVAYNLVIKSTIRGLVSLAEAEIPKLDQFDIHNEGEYRRSFTNLPTTLSSGFPPHEVVTPAMSLEHGFALRLFDYSAVYRDYKPEGMVITGHDLVRKMGFNTRQENGTNYVGFNQDWQVAYPNKLL